MKAVSAILALMVVAAPALGQLPTLQGPAPSRGPSAGPPQASPPTATPPTPVTTPAATPSGAPATPTPTPTRTPTGTATPTATPTRTPASGATPTPTGTPAPGATPAASSGGSSSSSTAAAAGSSGGSSSGITDADVLVFAYNLEVLEANFYSCAAFGTPISSSLTGGGPGPSSCTKASLSSSVGSYAAELAREEIAHVTLLYNSLRQAGGNPVAPLVNIDSAFQAAASAALGSNVDFNAYANDVLFLHAAFIFEDLGASAYLGALGLLQNATYRQVAAQIGNAESYHASLDRTLLYQQIDTTPAYGRTVGQITSAIVSAINGLAGSPQIKYTLTNDQGASISNVNSQGLVPVATPAQVLKVVTLGAASGSGGGFFPNNLSGNVKN